MIYRRKTYKVMPEQMDICNRFFHEHVLPNHLKHGAKLVGRWITATKDEIMELWEYPNYEEY